MKTISFEYNILLTLSISFLVFFIDIHLPLGIAGGVPYMLAVLITLSVQTRWYTYITAIVCSVLVVVGFYASPDTIDSEMWKVLINRSLALFVIWVTALMTSKQILFNAHEKGSKQAKILLDSAPNAMIMVDTDGIIKSVNQQTVTYFGYERAELIQHSLTKLFPEENRKQLLFSLSSASISSAKVEMDHGEELFGLKKNNKKFPVEITMNLIELDEGNAVLVSIVDVTEKKIGQLRLKESEKRYRSLIEESTSLTWETDADGRFLEKNPSWEEFTGQTFEAYKNFGWSQAIHPDDRDRLLTVWNEAVSNKSFYHNEARLYNKRTGEYHHFYVNAVPFLDEKGELASWFGANTDIHDIRTYQAELEDSQERFRNVIEASPNAIVLVNQQGKIVLANAQLERYFGYKREDLMGQPIHILMPKRMEKEHNKHVAHFFSNPSNRMMSGGRELIAQRKNNTTFPVEIGLTSLHTKEGAMALATIVDITERKKVEEKIKKGYKELEAVNKDLEQFAYIATHDIKTPVTNIGNYLNFLKQDHDIQKERSRMAIEWIDKSVNQARKTIEDLVLVTKERQEKDLKMEEVELRGFVENAKIGLQAEIEASKAIIREDFKQYPKVKYNKIKAKSLILNLMSNAIKYKSPERRPEIELTTESFDEYICLSVKDNGLGIDLAKDEEKVFGLFRRAHPKLSGSGIGLYMTKQSLENAGGKIEVESEVDKGTTFKVYFKK